MPLAPDQTTLNKYHILKLIGEGGMARVWLAEEITFGNRQVALKEPRDDLLPEDLVELRRRYDREVKVCAALDQAGVPNIVRAITAEPYGDGLLLVLEYLPGGDLAGLLRQHPQGLPIERAVQITLDVLRALQGAHDHPLEIVHRDVKPSNILFDEQGRALLGDFGFAQLAGMSQRSQLKGGQHPGTPLYMAPEQAISQDYLTPAADLYTLGCVLFEMLTGKRYKRVRPGTPASTLREDVPAWLDDVLARTLAEDPWDRWESAADMAEALEEGERAGRIHLAEIARATQEADQVEVAVTEHEKQEAVVRRPRTPIEFDWVTVPTGEFMMGSDPSQDKDAFDDEQPQHRVHVSEFRIARVPVTNAQYKAFVDATGHRAPSHWKNGQIPRGKEDHPVVYVSWEDAQAFCRWAGVRLPTEAEWEKAARGTDGRIYPWGHEWDASKLNSWERSGFNTTPVGTYPAGASPYGALDMAGNVWEWVADWYDSDYYSRSPGRSPTGPDTGASRVLRGGAWTKLRNRARCANRGSSNPVTRHDVIGFRCCAVATSSLTRMLDTGS